MLEENIKTLIELVYKVDFYDCKVFSKLFRHLDFRQAYTCSQDDLKAFLRSPKRCCSVHSLNLDGVYWFRPPLATIARMKKLVSLHLRGINITFCQLHGLLTAGLQVSE